MTAYAWDLLPETAQQQIIDRVVQKAQTVRIDIYLTDIFRIVPWAIDALGKSDVVENAAEVGFEEGHAAGYYLALAHIAALAEPQ